MPNTSQPEAPQVLRKLPLCAPCFHVLSSQLSSRPASPETVSVAGAAPRPPPPPAAPRPCLRCHPAPWLSQGSAPWGGPRPPGSVGEGGRLRGPERDGDSQFPGRGHEAFPSLPADFWHQFEIQYSFNHFVSDFFFKGKTLKKTLLLQIKRTNKNIKEKNGRGRREGRSKLEAGTWHRRCRRPSGNCWWEEKVGGARPTPQETVEGPGVSRRGRAPRGGRAVRREGRAPRRSPTPGSEAP